MPAARVAILATICIMWSFALGAAKLIVQIGRVEVVNNIKIVNATANIRRIGSHTSNVAEFQASVLQELSNLQVSTIYYVPSFDGNLDKPIYNHTVNFCTYLRRPTTDRVLQMIYEDLNRRGNLPKKCPITVGTYSFNSSFDSFRLPGFLPESNFRFDLNFYQGQQRELCFESHWFGRLRKVPS